MDETLTPEVPATEGRETATEGDARLKLEPRLEGSPLSVMMPAEQLILEEAYRLASNGNVSVRDLSTCVSQDPILILELLKVANSVLFSQDRPATTVAENAVVALGSAKVVEVLDSLASRPRFESIAIHREFERLRSRSRRTSIITRILAMAAFKSIASEAQTVALMSSIGHMVACVYFGETYAALSQRVSRGTLAYRMLHEQSFNVHKVQMAFLRRASFPELLLFALDRELTCKTPHRLPLRHLVEAAGELVDAFDADKWQKFSPDRELPASSAVRFLRFDAYQYQRVWERCDEYLNLARDEELLQQRDPSSMHLGRIHIEESSQIAPRRAATEQEEAQPSQSPLEEKGVQISSHVQLEETTEAARASRPIVLLSDNGLSGQPDLKSQSPIAPLSSAAGHAPKIANGERNGSMLFPVPPPRTFENEQFRVEDRTRFATQAAQEALDSLAELVKSVTRTSDLLEDLLNLLIQQGPFVRSGIFVVAGDGRSARLLRACGKDLGEGGEVIFSDPLCPLSACLQQIRSFNAQGLEDASSPLGVSAYAVSPLNIQNETPVFLYADCGATGSMTFESRRLFRYVVGMINQVLPTMEQGLPRAGSASNISS